jgi:hypothetical protein
MEGKLRSSSLCKFPQSSVTLPFLDPNIFLSILLSHIVFPTEEQEHQLVGQSLGDPTIRFYFLSEFGLEMLHAL